MFTALSVVVICVSRYATRRRHPFAHQSQDSQTQEQWMNSNSLLEALPPNVLLATFVAWPRLSYELRLSLELKWKPTVMLLVCLWGWGGERIYKELSENLSHLRMEGRAEGWSREAEKGSPVWSSTSSPVGRWTAGHHTGGPRDRKTKTCPTVHRNQKQQHRV